MGQSRRRSARSRDPQELKLAYGVTLSFVGMIVFYLVGSSFGGRGDPTWVIVFGAAAVLSWAWAIVAIRGRNAAGKTLEELQALSPDQFEEWTAARFRDLGYSVKVTGRGGDHGADLIVERTGEIAIVQCKRFRDRTVGEPVLRDLFGAMHDFGACKAYLVTTGRLTQAAADWARGKPIDVWDGDRVVELSARLADKDARPSPQPVLLASDPGPVPAVAAALVMTCPRCGSALVERRNRSTGEAFLGCSGYPRCRHTQPLAASGPASGA